MALVIMSGYPSSGKSTRAVELSRFFEHKMSQSLETDDGQEGRPRKRFKVVTLNDEALGIDKSAYDDSRAEKPARATLYSAVLREMNEETIVICDAMNYIKGARYQMYCAAREVKSRNVTVFIATPPDKCREWNAAREPRYIDPTLDNLIQRYEEPNSAARWDSPLVTVAHFDPPLDEIDKDGKGTREAEAIWEAATAGVLKPPNQAVLPTQTSTTSYLTRLEQSTSLLISTLLQAQSLAPLMGETSLTVQTQPPTQVTIELRKPVSLPMLQRHRRQFTKLNMQTGNEMSEQRIVEYFAKYLEGAAR